MTLIEMLLFCLFIILTILFMSIGIFCTLKGARELLGNIYKIMYVFAIIFALIAQCFYIVRYEYIPIKQVEHHKFENKLVVNYDGVVYISDNIEEFNNPEKMCVQTRINVYGYRFNNYRLTKCK